MNTNHGFSDLIDALSKDQLPTPSKKLDFLLRDVAWTTSSEFLGEFGVEMNKIKKAYGDRMSADTKEKYSIVALQINKVWPDMQL